jgi:hypothetical protein
LPFNGWILPKPRMEDFESEKAFEIAIHLPAKNF